MDVIIPELFLEMRSLPKWIKMIIFSTTTVTPDSDYSGPHFVILKIM